MTSTTPTSTPPPGAAPAGFLSMGRQTYTIPLTLFATNRTKLISRLREECRSADDDDANASNTADPPPLSVPTGSLVFLTGGPSTTRYDTDHEPLFRQESYFLYLFGVKEPDCSGLIDVDSGKCVLFVPRLPKEYATWLGRIKELSEFQEMYGVDEVMYVDEAEGYMEKILKKERTCCGGENGSMTNGDASTISSNGGTHHQPTPSSSTPKILLMQGTNSDSNNTYQPPALTSQFLQTHIDTKILYPILAECRVHKSPSELSLLRQVTELTSHAHVYTIRNTHPQMAEYQSESLFRHYCYYNYGCRLVGYTPICGCGPNGATLHYGHSAEPNGRIIKEGDLCLYDMGAEYVGGYGSDVTCTFPANGKFTKEQKVVYEGVLNAQRKVIEMMKPGVSWVDCHKAAEMEIIKSLVSLGIVVPGGNSVEELVNLRLGAVFMPCGLGHFIGIDTHDVGGYLPHCPPRIMEPGLKSLRTARLLEPDMVITVEPGCYFIDHLLNEALNESNPLHTYLNGELINAAYRGFGGIRLEDVVAVTDNGCTNYTLCPRTVEEVESVCTGGKWPPLEDAAPELKRVRLLDPSPLPLPSPPSL